VGGFMTGMREQSFVENGAEVGAAPNGLNRGSSGFKSAPRSADIRAIDFSGMIFRGETGSRCHPGKSSTASIRSGITDAHIHHPRRRDNQAGVLAEERFLPAPDIPRPLGTPLRGEFGRLVALI